MVFNIVVVCTHCHSILLCKSSQHRSCFWVDIVNLTNAVEYRLILWNEWHWEERVYWDLFWLIVYEIVQIYPWLLSQYESLKSLVIFGLCDFVLVASRRSSEELIFEGRVTVNGSVCNTPQVSFVIPCLLIGFSPPCRDGFLIQV